MQYEVSPILIVVFITINLIAFFVMLSDKLKSTRDSSPRISEGTLFFLAAAFGSLGVYVGMFVFRHKTQKLLFLLGIPLLFIENVATALVINYLFQLR